MLVGVLGERLDQLAVGEATLVASLRDIGLGCDFLGGLRRGDADRRRIGRRVRGEPGCAGADARARTGACCPGCFAFFAFCSALERIPAPSPVTPPAAAAWVSLRELGMLGEELGERELHLREVALCLFLLLRGEVGGRLRLFVAQVLVLDLELPS